MIAWLELSSPNRAFYSLAEQSSMPDLRFNRLVSFSALRRPLETGGGAESANISVEIDNGDGSMTAELLGELLKPATVKYVDSAGSVRTLFSGTVQRITMGASVQLDVVG